MNLTYASYNIDSFEYISEYTVTSDSYGARPSIIIEV